MDDSLFDEMDALQFQLGKEVVDTLNDQVSIFRQITGINPSLNDVSEFREKHENCSNCQFYRNEECRRFPPQIWGDGADSFPYVNKDKWCGEYRPTKASTEMLLKHLREEDSK